MTDAATAHRVIAAEWRVFVDRLVDGGPRRWTAPTRLDDWAVGDLAAHCCWGTSLEADALARSRAGVAEPATGGAPAPDAGRDEVLDRLRASRHRLVTELEILAGTNHGHDVPLPYGRVPQSLALSIFVMEAGVHGSDLAAALGADDTLAPTVCAATVDVLATFGPRFAEAADSVLDGGAVIEVRTSSGALRFGQRADGSWTAAADGPATTTITGADSEVCLFALGRRPLDAVDVTGDGALARSFKRLIPGP
jgi:uncharacterized protein (TIGR03083 family)